MLCTDGKKTPLILRIGDLSLSIQSEKPAVLLEPSQALFIIRHNLCHPDPEFFGVIGDLRMGEFVDDHIIDHIQRGKHQSPGETEASIRAAGAPARARR